MHPYLSWEVKAATFLDMGEGKKGFIIDESMSEQMGPGEGHHVSLPCAIPEVWNILSAQMAGESHLPHGSVSCQAVQQRARWATYDSWNFLVDIVLALRFI